MDQLTYSYQIPQLVPDGISCIMYKGLKVKVENRRISEPITDVHLGTALNFIVQDNIIYRSIDSKMLAKETLIYRNKFQEINRLNHSSYKPYIYTNYPNMAHWMEALSWIDEVMMGLACDGQLLGAWYLASDLVDLLRLVRPTKWTCQSVYFGHAYFGKFINSFYMIFHYLRARYDDATLYNLFPHPLASFIIDLGEDVLHHIHNDFLQRVRQYYNPVDNGKSWSFNEVLTNIDHMFATRETGHCWYDKPEGPDIHVILDPLAYYSRTSDNKYELGCLRSVGGILL